MLNSKWVAALFCGTLCSLQAMAQTSATAVTTTTGTVAAGGSAVGLAVGGITTTTLVAGVVAVGVAVSAVTQDSTAGTTATN